MDALTPPRRARSSAAAVPAAPMPPALSARPFGFSRVDDGHVILTSRGVEYQAELYQRAGVLYAKRGGGYIGLRLSGFTPVPAVRWLDMDVCYRKCDPHGRLELVT